MVVGTKNKNFNCQRKTLYNNYISGNGSKVKSAKDRYLPSVAMSGNLQMGNNQITGLSDPNANDHAVNKKYVNDNYLSLHGKKQMVAPLDMNDNRITGLTNNVLHLTVATNKQYVDNAIIKGNIKPRHTVKKYLMDDVNEWSTEWCGMVLMLRKLMIYTFPHIIGKKNVYLYHR